MSYSHTVAGSVYRFDDLKSLLAKATPERSGDQLAGLAARPALERMAARLALADLPLRTFLNDQVVPYESDEVTRLIVDTHDAAAFAPISHLTVGGWRDWLLSATTTSETLAALAGALRVSLGELLEEPPLGEVRIVRAGRLDRVEENCVALSERAWGPHELEEPEPAAAGTRAGVYVLEGKLIAGPVERVTELARGDYASFQIDVPHLYETERAAARALVLTYDE